MHLWKDARHNHSFQSMKVLVAFLTSVLNVSIEMHSKLDVTEGTIHSKRYRLITFFQMQLP